jgi:hypothetical protein
VSNVVSVECIGTRHDSIDTFVSFAVSLTNSLLLLSQSQAKVCTSNVFCLFLIFMARMYDSTNQPFSFVSRRFRSNGFSNNIQRAYRGFLLVREQPLLRRLFHKRNACEPPCGVRWTLVTKQILATLPFLEGLSHHLPSCRKRSTQLRWSQPYLQWLELHLRTQPRSTTQWTKCKYTL